MDDDELRRAYATLRDQRRQRHEAPGAGPRPDAEAIWSALSDDTARSDRVRILDEALRAGAGDDVALAHSMRSAALTAVEPAGSIRPPIVARRWWPVAAAAALLITVSVPLLRDAGGPRMADSGDVVRYRGGDAGAPTLVAPTRDTPLPIDGSFIWHAVTDARDYTLEAIDAEGRIVARVITADSVASLPVTVSPAERASITGWWVTATANDGSRARSELRLVAPAKRP